MPKDLAKLYGQEYYRGDGARTYTDYEAERRNFHANARRVISWLERFQSKGRLLEIGCAMGFFLEAARDCGWSTLGVEISDYAANIARSSYNLDVVCADFAEHKLPLDSNSFDAVVAMDVIEHLRHPEVLIQKAGRLLKKGGHLLLSTGDMDSLSAKISGRRWRLLAPPEHIFYFSRTGLNILLRRNDLELLSIRGFWKQYSLGAVSSMFGIDLPKAVAKIPISVNAGDVMYILARKSS